MKYTIMILILLSTGMLGFSQAVIVKPVKPSSYNSLFNSTLKIHNAPAKKYQLSLMDINQNGDHKYFLELLKVKYPEAHPTGRRASFMDGPVMFPLTNTNNSRSATISYQRYPATNSSAALTILGMVGSVVAGAVYPKYVGKAYRSSGAQIEAYMQTINQQDHK